MNREADDDAAHHEHLDHLRNGDDVDLLEVQINADTELTHGQT